jgi:hypothetical protein
MHESSQSSTPPASAAPPPQSVTLAINPQIPPAKRLSSQLYFPHFVDHTDDLVVFFETVAARRWAQRVNCSAAASAASSLINYHVDEQPDTEDKIAEWNTPS